jgi:hypothetical protein
MDKTYADTVRLLLAVAPDVFANDIFAMKGGTAINLFVRDMPRGHRHLARSERPRRGRLRMPPTTVARASDP